MRQHHRRLRARRLSGRVRQFRRDDLLVNHQGTVFEKDLGVDTARIAGGMTAFDPDASWKSVDAGAPSGAPLGGQR
jgi:hypothetical protein